MERDVFRVIRGTGFPHNGMQDPDLRRGFQAALTKVREGDRQVLEAYWDLNTGRSQRTVSEVATLLKMNRNTAHDRLQRGIRALRSLFIHSKDERFKEALRMFNER